MSPLIRRRKKTGRKKGMPALWVAAIAILIPVFITYYAFHKRLPFTSEYTDYAIVSNSVNVRPGSPVRIAGIDVGAVESTSPDGDATKIAFSLSSNGRPLHTDATMTIRDRLFLEGGYYLDIFPGSPSAPTAGQGFTIEEKSTASPVQFFQLLSTFDLAARSSLDQLLDTANQAFSAGNGVSLAASGAAGLKEAIPQLTPVLKDTAWISQAFTGTHYNDVETFLSSAAAITTTLADKSTELTSLVTGLDRTSGALAAADGSLAESISGLDQTLQAAPPALTAIDRSLGPVSNLSEALTPALEKSPPLVTALDNEVKSVNAVVTPSLRQPLLSSIRTLFATFPGVLVDLGKAFPATHAVTACLQTRVVPLLDEAAQDGSLSTGDPVWKDFVHMLPELAGASGDFDADGSYVRALVGVGNDTLSGLGNLPGLGSIVGDLPAGSSSSSTSAGVSPQWVGDLTASDFRPDVSCTTQPVPALTPDAAGTNAAADLRVHSTSPSTITASEFRSDWSKAVAKVKAASR